MEFNTKEILSMVFPSLLSVIAIFVTSNLNLRKEKKFEFQMRKQEAYLSAFRVIDKIFANTEFDNKPPVGQHEWEAGEAREAMNKLILFSEFPNEAIYSYLGAILIIKDNKTPTMHLDDLRSLSIKDLGFKSDKRVPDGINTWIAALPGAKN